MSYNYLCGTINPYSNLRSLKNLEGSKTLFLASRKLSVNTTKETIQTSLLSIQIDKYESLTKVNRVIK